MAISGAFGAGFVEGFGESMKKNAETRAERQQRYVDNMMENARRMAPKYAQDQATATSVIDLMNEFETRYGVSNEEFIALYQTHDINKVYENIQIAENGLRDGQKLDVKNEILGALKIPEGAKLPEGMSAEDAVRSMILGYAQNVSQKPNDNSEANKNNSWAKAISDVLVLNPRASAEEQISAMKVAGVPVQQILQYQASAGGTFRPLEGVQRTGNINFDDGYRDGDYDSTVSSYTSAFTRTFAKTNDLSTLVDGTQNYTDALASMNAPTMTDLVSKINKGAVAMADLELGLANTGVRPSSRSQSMRTLAAEVNTAQEFDNMTAAIKSGLAGDMIRESISKHGTLTDEYVALILKNQAPKKDEPRTDRVISVAPGADVGAAVAAQMAEITGEAPSLAEMQAGRFDREVLPQQPIDPSLNNAGIVSGLVGGDSTSDTAPSVSASEDPSVTMQNLSNLYSPTEDKDMSVEDRINAKREATTQIAGDIADTLENVGDKLAAVDKALDVATGNAVLNIRAKANTTLGAIAQIAGKEELADSFYKTAIEAEDGSRKGVRLDQGMYQALNEMFDDMGIFMPSEIAPAEDAVNAFVDAPNTEGRDLDADLGIGYEPATTRLYSTMDRLKKLRLVLEQEEVTPEQIVEAVSKPERAIGTVGFQDLGLREDVRPQEEAREPEMISYEEWKDMSKADRKKIGLDLSLYAIQNRTRGGRIPIPEGYSLPARLRMDQPENMATPEAEAAPRVPADEAIMTRPTKQDLTAPTAEEGISVERSTGTSKALAELRTTFNRIHGKKSNASKRLEKVLQQAQSGTPIQYTDVNQLLRVTRSLPKTKTRDELAKKLYDLAQGLR